MAALKYAVREGVSANPAVDPAAKLLLDAPIDGGDNLLLIEAGCGALLAQFAPRFSRVISQNSFQANHASSLETCETNGFQNVLCLLDDIPKATEASAAATPISLEALSRYPAGCFDAIVFRLS